MTLKPGLGVTQGHREL